MIVKFDFNAFAKFKTLDFGSCLRLLRLTVKDYHYTNYYYSVKLTRGFELVYYHFVYHPVNIYFVRCTTSSEQYIRTQHGKSSQSGHSEFQAPQTQALSVLQLLVKLRNSCYD